MFAEAQRNLSLLLATVALTAAARIAHADDCNGNGIPDLCDLDCDPPHSQCDVPGCGTAFDCNDNGVPDECDIVDGTSVDCNNTGIPDECEDDCNNNGVADSCDIADGTSPDSSQNGIPDECEWVTMSLLPIEAHEKPGDINSPLVGTITEAGDEIMLEEGGVNVWLEIRVSDFDANDTNVRLYSWDAAIDTSGFVSGLHGTLVPKEDIPLPDRHRLRGCLGKRGAV